MTLSELVLRNFLCIADRDAVCGLLGRAQLASSFLFKSVTAYELCA